VKLNDFYTANPARLPSREADYGVMWTRGPGVTWPQWRVSYVMDTGEVYACCLGGGGQRGDVLILGTYPPGEGDEWTRALDELLDGWWQQRDLEWVQTMLAGTCRCGAGWQQQRPHTSGCPVVRGDVVPGEVT
jgi:hypothetical protein